MDNQSSIISFVLDDEVVSIDFDREKGFKPTTTVLNYLRSLEGHKGVKEGCSIGDCGACTVVIGELSGQRIKYKAINSCLVFLPYLHGKQLITIENISYEENNQTHLHPVQQAMLDTHGTQCGFCTPGIIMSLFAFYKSDNNPDKKNIEKALSGNLCRCTGYKQIIEAAQLSCTNKQDDHFSARENEIISKLQKIKQKNIIKKFSRGKKKYFKSFTLNEALILKKEFPQGKILAGATDITPQHNRYKTDHALIIDITDIPEIKFFEQDKENYYIGAGSTLEDLAPQKIPAFNDIIELFGSTQIRNLATVGGNIVNASPVGDLLPLLFVHDVKLELRRIDDSRTICIKDFISSYRKTLLEPDEILYRIIIPIINDNSIVRVYKISKRNDLDISSLSVAFRMKKENNIVKDISIVFGGMAAVPKHASMTEKFLENKKWTKEIVEQASEIIQQDFDPISDVRANKEYRMQAARNLLLKFWNDLLNGE
jgi:xanthine dehydrogenase small subunit